MLILQPCSAPCPQQSPKAPLTGHLVSQPHCVGKASVPTFLTAPSAHIPARPLQECQVTGTPFKTPCLNDSDPLSTTHPFTVRKRWSSQPGQGSDRALPAGANRGTVVSAAAHLPRLIEGWDLPTTARRKRLKLARGHLPQTNPF